MNFIQWKMFHHGDKEGKKSAFGHPVNGQIVLSIILLLPPFLVTAFPANTVGKRSA